MSSFPCLARFVSGSGQVRYRLGDRLVDRYLEFVAGRCRPDTLRAVAFGLKAYFVVVAKDPAEVTAADVFDFLADQRGDLPGNRSPEPLWLWSSAAGTSAEQVDRVWHVFLRRFDLEYTDPVPQAGPRLDPAEAAQPGRR